MLVKKELLEIIPPKNTEKERYRASAEISAGKRSGKILAVFLYDKSTLTHRIFFDKKTISFTGKMMKRGETETRSPGSAHAKQTERGKWQENISGQITGRW